MKIELIGTNRLSHIEGFSRRRVEWLKEKIIRDGLWTKPIALEQEHHLVLDGQHRMEAAIALGLKRVPVVRFCYSEVAIRSLRPQYECDWKRVVERALAGDIYPYKTVKHKFPLPIPACAFKLDELRR